MLVTAARLSDEALLARMKVLSGQSREVTVELIAHLVEVARRGIHRAEGPGKLFGYLTGVLRFSEAAAWNRIQAARAVRRFPMVLDLLADGSVNLTTIRLLVPHLTKENHRSLLAEATGKGKSDLKKMVARLAPRPDVPATIRKLPAPAPAPLAAEQPSAPSAPVQSVVAGARPVETSPVASAPRPESHRPIVEPLAPERYRLQLTMDEQAHGDLRWLQDAMRREIPDGDPAMIVARALAAPARTGGEEGLRRDFEAAFVSGNKAGLARHSGRGSADGLASRRRPVRLRRRQRKAMRGAQLPRIPPWCGGVLRGWRSDGGEHLAPLPRPQRLRGGAALRSLRVARPRDVRSIRRNLFRNKSLRERLGPDDDLSSRGRRAAVN